MLWQTFAQGRIGDYFGDGFIYVYYEQELWSNYWTFLLLLDINEATTKTVPHLSISGIVSTHTYSEDGYGINIQVEKSKNMTIVKFMECDLNQLFWIFVDSWMW